MLTQKEIQMFTVPKENKILALVDVIQFLDDADNVLGENIYGYMPLCQDEQKQDEADNVFWSSELMDEINDVAVSIGKIRDFAKQVLRSLNDNTPTKAAS